MSRIYATAAIAAAMLTVSAPALAATELETLKAQMAQMQERLNQLEAQQAQAAPVSTAPSGDNAFNPAIGAVLNGHYGSYSGDDDGIAGFAIGEEAGRSAEGLAVDEAEVTLKANIDDMFAGTLTAALHAEDGETEVELEEAHIKTIGLPAGIGVKAGRFMMPVGYINENHKHTDDFADRALPNRAFLNGSYKDDGALVSWQLPTDIYSEVGAGVVRGSNFPGGGEDGENPGAWTAYGKLGGDIGNDQSWLLGLSTLQSSPDERSGNDDAVLFEGDSDIYAVSGRYTWAPTGNAKEQEVSFQGEYFLRDEDGTYEDVDAGTGAVDYNDQQSGWYAQGVYKFAPQWRVGARYSRLNAGDVPAGLVGSALDGEGHDPWNATLMADWSRSEFSRVRAQVGREESARGEEDDQFILQYIMSLGAHPAHSF